MKEKWEISWVLGLRKKGQRIFLTQTGLITKVLQEANMSDCDSTKTPCSTAPLGKDIDGNSFSEDWEYSAVVGMLMYLVINSRPDIDYAVNQRTRFTHNPKDSHATGVKRILRYLKGTRTKGMTIQPTDKHDVHCYVDADFGGL
jgi:hypothetical protein